VYRESFTAGSQVYLSGLGMGRASSVNDWLSLVSCLLSFDGLLLSIDFRLSVNDFFATGEVLSPAGFVHSDALHPRVSQNLLHGRSLAWFERDHPLEQVFELLREDLLATICMLMKLPEGFVLSRS